MNIIRYTIPYNIYYGSIGKTLGVKYRLTKNFKNEAQALEYANTLASSLYYKNEGKYGLPSYNQIAEESDITGIGIQDLYEEHIKDMMRWYVIPTEDDTIPQKNLKY